MVLVQFYKAIPLWDGLSPREFGLCDGNNPLPHPITLFVSGKQPFKQWSFLSTSFGIWDNFSRNSFLGVLQGKHLGKIFSRGSSKNCWESSNSTLLTFLTMAKLPWQPNDDTFQASVLDSLASGHSDPPDHLVLGAFQHLPCPAMSLMSNFTPSFGLRDPLGLPSLWLSCVIIYDLHPLFFFLHLAITSVDQRGAKTQSNEILKALESKHFYSLICHHVHLGTSLC